VLLSAWLRCAPTRLQLVARRWTYRRRRCRRPMSREVREVILRIARENPR
jgi:hypothetical protein